MECFKWKNGWDMANQLKLKEQAILNKPPNNRKLWNDQLNYSKDSWKDERLLLSSGFIFLISIDSEIMRSSLLEAKVRISKSRSVKGWSRSWLCCLTAENEGLLIGKPVRRESPLCSKYLCLNQREVDPR